TTPGRQGLYDPANEHDSCGIGLVANIKGRKSHDIVRKAIQVLFNLEHRGACGCETNTGDGAGILLQLPTDFFKHECEELQFDLPEPGQYAVGVVFLPNDSAARSECEQLLEKVAQEEGQHVIGWRTVPTDNSLLGPTARASQPFIRQIIIGRGPDVPD